MKIQAKPVQRKDIVCKTETFSIPVGYDNLNDYLTTLEVNQKIMLRNPKKYESLIKRDQAEIIRLKSILELALVLS